MARQVPTYGHLGKDGLCWHPQQHCKSHQKGEEEISTLRITVETVLRAPLAVLKMKRNFERGIKGRMIWF